MIVMKRVVNRIRGAALLVAAAPLVAACGGVGPAEPTRPQVVASFYPLQYVGERVAGAHADVEVLTAPGQEPHDLELHFAQTAAVAEADVLVVAHGLQPAVDDAVAQAGAEHVVDAAEVIDLLAGGESDQEHEEHAAAADHHGDQDVDPHFWLDPVRLADLAAAVADELSQVDPQHADHYAANLDTLQDDLAALDEEFAGGLADCARDTIVVSHDAFGYLGARYGLRVESINGLSPDAEPSPAHLARLADLIRSEGITTVFSERSATRELAQTLASELGLETAVLDPVEGLSDATAGEDYLSLMRADLAAIRKANDCR
jgi:zinc transport system substrate-binding protein